MGNNPSRSSQQSTSSASASPTGPGRATSSSSRRPGYRRNSLQHAASSVKYTGSPATATAQDFSSPTRPRQEGNALGCAAQHLAEIRTAPPRRESIAETPTAGRSGAEDSATLKQFPSPPTPKVSNTVPTTPVTFNEVSYEAVVDPFLASIPAAKPHHQHHGSGTVHRGSVDSASTLNETEVPEPDTRAVPTLVEWPYGGNKVYLTGTFCGWAKKYRLTKSPSNENVMSAVVPIPPGTHHVKFIVDGEMRTSQAIPTAVDDTGILVNYLEVSADDMPPLDRQLPLDGCHKETGRSTERLHTSQAPVGKKYTTEIPAYLRDIVESHNDDFADRGPPPPSLPMMLQKVILNASSQTKDDASVLSIPNHAVLNHLATSSIKNHILAVSATTRYKKKYVTTLLYKAAGSS